MPDRIDQVCPSQVPVKGLLIERYKAEPGYVPKIGMRQYAFHQPGAEAFFLILAKDKHIIYIRMGRIVGNNAGKPDLTGMIVQPAA